MTDRLDGLYRIDLAAGRELERFYAQFAVSPAAAMNVRNFDAQIM